MWPQMQHFQLLTAVWKCRALSWGFPLLVGSPASHLFPIPCSQDSTPSACPQPVSIQAVPQRHGPMHCGTARLLIPKDHAPLHVLRTHPAKHKCYEQYHCSSASHSVSRAVRKGACFPFSLPALSPVTVPPLSKQLPSSPCLYQIQAGLFPTNSGPQQNCKSFQN